MYSKRAYLAIKAETTENVTVKPDTFVGLVSANVQTKFGHVLTSAIMAARDLASGAVPGRVDEPAGTVTVETEPKTFPHFIKASFGALLSGVYFPTASATGVQTKGGPPEVSFV